jgi:predicted methyltransferase
MQVLDTATGLGYTAIATARCPHVNEVVTIEVDHAPLELCRYNPWSQELFASNKIKMLQGK